MPVEDHHQVIAQWLSEFHQVPLHQVENHSYFQQAGQAVKHMMRVASGLDSMVLGEPQILGQLKSSFSVARQEKTATSHLIRMFQSAFNMAKFVRTHTAIGENPVSVAYAAVAMAKQIFARLEDQTALLIGAGETIELVARHLHDAGLKKIIVANRTLARAQELAHEFNAQAVLLADIPDHLAEADIVISSTASQLPILGKGAVERALKQRKHQLMFMVDIAVPRDIEAEVGDLDDVYLYTVDDLQEVILENMRSRENAANKAEKIIEEGVSEWKSQLQGLDVVDMIRAFTQDNFGQRSIEAEKALLALRAGQDPEDIVRSLARNLTNKLLHAPSRKLKQVGERGRKDHIRLAGDLFGLQKSDKNESNH